MLKAEHIMSLKLDRNRLAAHQRMPAPSFVKKELTGQITAIGEAVIGELFEITPDIFSMQLNAARQFGVSLLTQDSDQRIVGVSAATSLIRQGTVIQKNMILPEDYMYRRGDFDRHCVIGVFLRGSVVDGRIPDVEDVEIAGWMDTDDIQKHRKHYVPETFQSKLPVVMVPCWKLDPIATLLPQLTA